MAKAGKGAANDVEVVMQQCLVSYMKSIKHTGPEVVEDDVRILYESLESRSANFLTQVEFDTALISVES